MLKLYSLLFCYCLLMSSSAFSQQGGFTIQGLISNSQDGDTVTLYDIDQQQDLDTGIIHHSKFTLSGKVDRPTTCWFRYNGEYAILQVENTAMTLVSSTKDLRVSAKINGGKEQDLQNQLQDLQLHDESIAQKYWDSLMKNLAKDKADERRIGEQFNEVQQRIHNIYINFGKQHYNSFLGLDIIYRNRQTIGKDSVSALLTKMEPVIRSSDKAQSLALFVNDKLVREGQVFSDFRARTLEGDSFNLSSMQGKYMLLTFWSAGCGPCRMENKSLSKKYNTFKDDLTIVSFSLDRSIDSWKKASEADNILWTNVSDLQGPYGPIKTVYDVQAMPTSYLIDKQGMVVKKYIGIDDQFLDNILALIRK